MKLRLLVIISLVVGGFFVASTHPANAATTITPEMVTRIRDRCVENQAALNRLHKTDAFIRIDRGSLYKTISDKLMVPLNRRLASNQLDGANLLTITSDYNAEYNRFYRAYIEYDTALSKVLDIDCDREPVAFYNALIDARTKRAKVAESIVKIKDLIRQYGTAFTELKTTYERDNP